MWFFYALTASVLWGISYAAIGRILEQGFPPSLAKTLESLFAVGTIGLFCAFKYKGSAFQEIARLGPNLWWLLVAVGASAVANLCILSAIGASSATLASLVEISYPLFVAAFAWLLFGQRQIDGLMLVGMFLIAAGTMLLYFKR